MTLPKRFQKPATYGKEVLTLKGPDMVRKLVVPGPEPNVHPIYFDKGQFCRLVKQSKVQKKGCMKFFVFNLKHHLSPKYISGSDSS